MNHKPTYPLTVESLCQRLQTASPAVQMVEARILRRVIRLDRRLSGLGLSLLRRRSYTIERERLLSFVDRSELDLPSGAELPKWVILLARPTEEEMATTSEAQLIAQQYDRLLYHETVHVALRSPKLGPQEAQTWSAARRREIGEIEFAEIRSVLVREDALFPTPSDSETYLEFVAFYLELRHFAASALPLYFPAIRDWEDVDRIVAQDIDCEKLLLEMQAIGPAAAALTAEEDSLDEERPQQWGKNSRRMTLVEFRRCQAKAERAAAVGNRMRAAIIHTQAARRAPRGHAAEAYAGARAELMRVAKRLQQVLQLSEPETVEWAEALLPLLEPASKGFWSNEARLLYDVQKVCIEQERGVYRLDLIEWIRTRGKRPIRRPLPLLRDALMTRHLRTASRRAATARVRRSEHELLTRLLASAVERIETNSRDGIRPLMKEVFDEVGLIPQNVPEQVAQRKLIEELIDRVVERRYFSMADVRDALSKNDLKLPDVSTVSELMWGDRLLQADAKLDNVLDGVYRRGAVYQRWPQTISSLAFGTRIGRFLTQYLAIPFGGAYLTLAFLVHLPHMFSGHSDVHHAKPGWGFYLSVLAMGTWIYLLMHRPKFREWNIAMLRQLWRVVHEIVIALPSRVINSKLVERILHSQLFTGIYNYVLRPAFTTLLLAGGWWLVGNHLTVRLTTEIFLVTALFLNTAVGRYAWEVTGDFFVRVFHELRLRLFTTAIQAIMSIFHGLLVWLERLVYMVDDWLLFRAGDNRGLQAIKLITGVAWFFVSYVVMFAFTLLIEPQVNPIKHFPVVTVSHKLLLPLSFTRKIAENPSPFAATLMVVLPLSIEQANWFAWSIIWLIPGVFGFLVWELKENWRLYAANRSQTLSPTPIGHHAETMTRLLRPGFHSGTLPKAYAALRRAVRKVEQGGDVSVVHGKEAAIHHIEEAVHRFVQRSLLQLLEEAGFPHTLNITHIHSATNRIDVELQLRDLASEPLRLTWEEEKGRLIGSVSRIGWLEALRPAERATFLNAVTGLFQLAGVDEARGALPIKPSPPIEWDAWVLYWSQSPGIEDEARPLPDAVQLTGPSGEPLD